jgi:hypothetical protein
MRINWPFKNTSTPEEAKPVSSLLYTGSPFDWISTVRSRIIGFRE